VHEDGAHGGRCNANRAARQPRQAGCMHGSISIGTGCLLLLAAGRVQCIPTPAGSRPACPHLQQSGPVRLHLLVKAWQLAHMHALQGVRAAACAALDVRAGQKRPAAQNSCQPPCTETRAGGRLRRAPCRCQHTPQTPRHAPTAAAASSLMGHGIFSVPVPFHLQRVRSVNADVIFCKRACAEQRATLPWTVQGFSPSM
jgi:hypothetical protein